ncbi:MAG: MDR family MFS transporter [Candidatus Nanopelagicales bacterium]
MNENTETTYLNHKEIVPILVGLMSGLFLAALDQTIVATAIKTIGDDLNGLSLQAWATTAYLITSTITTPLYGKLSDIFGRKPLFIWAISIFIIGSALSAFATSMYNLAIYRAIQGLGAGGLFTLALAIIGDIVPPRERSKYQGYFIAVFGSSSVLGPVIGGFFAGQNSIIGITGWRWVFLVNVPIGLIALFIVGRTLHIPNFQKVNHSLDWLGAISLTVGLIPLLLVAQEGRIWGWTSVESITCYTIGIISLILFLVFENKMKDEAILPLRLFKDKTFSLVSIVGLITGAGMFGGLAMLPLYLQIVGGSSPTKAGLELLPLTLGIMTGSIISGRVISKTGKYKIFPVIGTIILTITLFLMTTFNADTKYWWIAILSYLFGVGLGHVLQPTVIAVQNAVAKRDLGVATSSVTLFRQLGATVGTAAFISILFGKVGSETQTAFQNSVTNPEYQKALMDPNNASTVQQLQALQTGQATFDDTSWLASANRTLIHPILDGFANSMTYVFLIGAIVVSASIIFAILTPNNKLSERGDTAPASH